MTGHTARNVFLYVFRMNVPVMDPRVKRQGAQVVVEAAQVVRNPQMN